MHPDETTIEIDSKNIEKNTRIYMSRPKDHARKGKTVGGNKKNKILLGSIRQINTCIN